MKPNIFWILSDGTRNKPGKDRYRKIESFQEFEKEAVYFENAITSAPSTLMSISSTLTGRFGYELYPVYKFIKKEGLIYKTYIDVLKKNGYKINASVFQNEAGRRIFKDLLNTTYNDFPEELKNAEGSYKEFIHIMNKKFDKKSPNLVFIHIGYWDRKEPVVKKIFNYLKENNHWENSIIITSSDHGYVDYGTFHPLGWAIKPRTHSYYLDKDSYNAVLSLKLPKSLTKIKQKTIKEPVALLDLYETIFDYIGLNFDTKFKRAHSLKPRIEDDKDKEFLMKRVLRVDARYCMQNYRETRLINGFKTFLIKPGQESRLPKNFREAYQKINKETLGECQGLIKRRFDESELSKIKNKRIIIYNFNQREITEIVYEKLKDNNEVAILDLKNIKQHYKKVDLVLAFVDNSYFYKINGLHKLCKLKKITLKIYDNYFDPLPYKKYKIFEVTKNDSGLKKTNYNSIMKFGLFMILVGLNIYEAVILGFMKYKYHPIVKFKENL